MHKKLRGRWTRLEWSKVERVRNLIKMQTGKYLITKSILDRENVKKLKELADQKLLHENTRPLYIAKEKSMGNSIIERYENAGITSALGKCSKIITREIGNKWLILENKVLLRRTWPMSKIKSEKINNNASNLTWHQDSNKRHRDKQMVVILCSLDDNFGIDKPGVQIMDTETNKFEGIYGYEGHKVWKFEREIMQRHGVLKLEMPTLDKGDGIIFNGLTFHRTYSTENMNYPRDALLIRIINPKDAKNFEAGQHLVIKKQQR